MELVVSDFAISIDVEMALVVAAIGDLVLELVELLVTQILLIMQRFGRFSNLLDISLGLFRQVIGLLKLKKDLGLEIHSRRTPLLILLTILVFSTTISTFPTSTTTLQDVGLVDLVRDVDLLRRSLEFLIFQTHCISLKSVERIVPLAPGVN